MPFTAKQKRECAEREVKQRLRVYPRLVEANKITPGFATEQTKIMQEIADEYREKEKSEQLI